MGPTLLLDKSTFQALSREETQKLFRYFDWNRVDILLWEIIGDFFKQTGTSSSRNEVSILSDKISVFDSYQNVNYIELLVHNLLGDYVSMDGRPVVQPSTITQLGNGQTGAFIDDTQFCKMIDRWQRGEFTEEDILLANIWKDIKKDCNAKAANYLPLLTAHHIIFPACKDIIEMKQEVDKLLLNPRIQSTFLDMLLAYQGVDSERRRIIKCGIEEQPYPLQIAAPYAFYCLTVFALFLASCKHDLFANKKSDDQIDLEYLLYLPFCKVFSSNDSFHNLLAPQLIRADQVFIPGSQLKEAILNVDAPPIHEENMNSMGFPIPPMTKNS